MIRLTPDGAHLFIVALCGRLALTPALSPKERVRGDSPGPGGSNDRVRQRLERGDTGRRDEGRFRVPSPGGEGQGEGGPCLPTTMKSCALPDATAEKDF